MAAPPDTTLVLALSYPAGTTFTVTACVTGSNGVCLEDTSSRKRRYSFTEVIEKGKADHEREQD